MAEAVKVLPGANLIFLMADSMDDLSLKLQRRKEEGGKRKEDEGSLTQSIAGLRSQA